MPKTSRELLEEMLKEQEAGTYVDPVLSSKALLGGIERRELAEKSAVPTQEEQRLQRGSTLMGQIRENPMRTVREGVMGAALPLSFAGGPVGMAAGIPLALEGINAAIEDPSVTNVGFAALGALPFAGPVSRAAKGAREAKAITRMRATEGAGDMGAAYSREVPYRAGSGASSPSKSPTAQNLRQDATVKIGRPSEPGDMSEAGLDRLIMSRQPRGIQELSHPGAQRAMNEGFRQNNPVFRKMAMGGAWGQRGIDDAIESMSREVPMGSVVDDVPVEQVAPGAEDVDALLGRLQQSPEEAFSNFQSGSTPSHLATLDKSHDAFMQRARPSAETVHPADTSGGAFGFDELPEISESELSRMQALWKRLGL